ncbi:MAG: transglycosylase domain-containing protein, partial [Clostridia bacterium]|nr:transglycosylase domain-containing protein [Clostridia bacterium]
MQQDFENKERVPDNTETRGYDPVVPEDANAGGSGSTRRFSAVQEADPAQEPQGGGEKKKSKTGAAVKFTLKGALFTLRKIVTYLLNVLFTVLLVGIITGAVIVFAFVVYIKNYVDADYTGLDNLRFDSSLSTTMYYVDGSGKEIMLENDTLESSENRMWAEYAEIPSDLVNAYVAVEDKRFWEHDGVDTTRTASAIYNFFIPTSANYGGGSTITQQLIKNVSGENETTIQRKVQEIFRAMNVEKKYTKSEIMEMYLNTIYLSHGCYGVRVAAQTYFGKDLSELTLAECASIASIGKWPTHYDPISNPINNLTRRNQVLKLMLEQGKITEEQFNEAYDAPLRLAQNESSLSSSKVHSYYIDAVMDDVMADLMDQYGYDKATASRMLYSGGLEIVTCLDPQIQACLEKVFTDTSYWPEQNGIQAQSAMCIMDASSGNILAMVGGLGEKRESRGLNRATQSKRQCGSSIKPISVYAYAIETGLYNYATPVDDVPQIYNEKAESYWPKNSDNKFRGRVSLDQAIQASYNTVAVHTCELLGLENVFNNLIDSGYTTLVNSVSLANGTVLTDIGLSPLALGSFTYGVTVREHTQAYATLANDGITSKSRTYTTVRDSKGTVILENKEVHKVLYSETTAATITSLLQDVVVGEFGTGRKKIDFYSKYNVQVAGKTGTTNDKKDVYFCGYTPDFVATCWYGYDNNKAITASGNCAAQLWNSVFDEIYSYYSKNGLGYSKKFTLPSSLVSGVEYCTLSGKLATDACRNDLYYLQGGTSCVAKGVFKRSEVPTKYCDCHVMCKWDKKTKA